jgi:hypothetical protein
MIGNCYPTADLKKENVTELWTWNSLLIARTLLFVSYSGIVGAVLILSLGVIALEPYRARVFAKW